MGSASPSGSQPMAVVAGGIVLFIHWWGGAEPIGAAIPALGAGDYFFME